MTRHATHPKHTASLATLMLAMVLGTPLTASLSGCTQRNTSPYSTPREGARDPVLAERLNREAAAYIDTDEEKAERLLRRALEADLFFGPAHNNLGVLHLRHGRLYEAAHEFEWARKLMPGHPDPRVNLALTLEQAGRAEEAINTYAAALEARPDHLPAIQAMARCQLRYNRSDDRTEPMLRTIAMRSDDEQWRQWARLQLLRFRDKHP